MFSSSAVLFERPDTLSIHFEEILKYGTLGGVRVGSTFETLAFSLPAPDYIWEDDENIELCYGDIRIFMEDDRVSEIFIPIDTEDGMIDGGKSCEVEYSLWGEMFQNVAIYFLMVLLEMEIDYKLTHESDSTLCVETINGGAKCYFERYDEDDCFSLTHIIL